MFWDLFSEHISRLSWNFSMKFLWTTQDLEDSSRDGSQTNTGQIQMRAVNIILIRSSCTWYRLNRPISQIPECICAISHNATFCNRNVHMCAHFCYKMVHYGIFVWCIVGFVRWVYWCRVSNRSQTINIHHADAIVTNISDISGGEARDSPDLSHVQVRVITAATLNVGSQD